MRWEPLTFPVHRTILLFLLACFLQAASACARDTLPAPPQEVADREDAVDINSASREELRQLPGIGDATAGKIIAHRERFGAFRRKEHLLLVEGLSEKKYFAIEDQITAGSLEPDPKGHSSRGSNGNNKAP